MCFYSLLHSDLKSRTNYLRSNRFIKPLFIDSMHEFPEILLSWLVGKYCVKEINKYKTQLKDSKNHNIIGHMPHIP